MFGLHARKQRLSGSHFLRIRQRPIEIDWRGTWRFIHVNMKESRNYSLPIESNQNIYYFFVGWWWRVGKWLRSVLYNIMSNQFLTTDYKHRLRSAARVGRDFQLCGRYECPALSERSFSDWKQLIKIGNIDSSFNYPFLCWISNHSPFENTLYTTLIHGLINKWFDPYLLKKKKEFFF